MRSSPKPSRSVLRFGIESALLDRNDYDVQPIELEIDPGSKTNGIALVVEGARRGRYIALRQRAAKVTSTATRE
jgi:hypothetical protein